MSDRRRNILLRRRRRQNLGGPTVITTFTQSLGAELLVNGDFSAWTGDNPDGWTVTGESGSDPMVTQVASGGGAGTGAARVYSSSALITAAQNIFTVGDNYEIVANLSAYTSGQMRAFDSAGKLRPLPSLFFSAAGNYRYFGFAGSIDLYFGAFGACDAVYDSVSAKKITPNAAYAFGANGTFDFHFTLPGTPAPGEAAQLVYRSNTISNSWRARVQRNLTNNNYDFILDSVASGTVTNRLNVTSIGTAPNALRVVAAGDNHTCYTSTDDGANWTQRGTTVNNSANNTNVNVFSIYSSTVTPNKLVLNA